jgi:hypothetical protein
MITWWCLNLYVVIFQHKIYYLQGDIWCFTKFHVLGLYEDKVFDNLCLSMQEIKTRCFWICYTTLRNMENIVKNWYIALSLKQLYPLLTNSLCALSRKRGGKANKIIFLSLVFSFIAGINFYLSIFNASFLICFNSRRYLSNLCKVYHMAAIQKYKSCPNNY